MVYVINACSRLKKAKNMHSFTDISFKLKPWKQGDLVAELPLNLIERGLQMWNKVLAEEVVVGNANHIQPLLITGLRKRLRCGCLLSGFEAVSNPVPRIRGVCICRSHFNQRIPL